MPWDRPFRLCTCRPGDNGTSLAVARPFRWRDDSAYSTHLQTGHANGSCITCSYAISIHSTFSSSCSFEEQVIKSKRPSRLTMLPQSRENASLVRKLELMMRQPSDTSACVESFRQPCTVFHPTSSISCNVFAHHMGVIKCHQVCAAAYIISFWRTPVAASLHHEHRS